MADQPGLSKKPASISSRLTIFAELARGCAIRRVVNSTGSQFLLGHVSVQAMETELFPIVEGSHANRKLRNHQGRRNGATYSSGSDPALSAESANPSKRQTICRLIGELYQAS
jgi:hypothetical protein